MTRRFTIIQGGLSEASAPATEKTAPAAAWRIALRRSIHVDESEIDAWRALNDQVGRGNPFTDPDFLVTAAQHAPRLDGGIVFALAYAVATDGGERLAGVLPLDLPHPLWGGSVIRLWQPALAPHPIAPLFAAGSGDAVIAAALRHLRSVRPRTELHLDGEGTAVSAGAAHRRSHQAGPPRPAAIPQTQFVAVGGQPRAERFERVTAPEQMRDAVERFLLADARHAPEPILRDPAAAATIRVVTRLLARRGLVEVELGIVDGEPVIGTIRLGTAGERMIWCNAGLEGAAPRPGPGTNVDRAMDRAARDVQPRPRLRLVASRG